MAAVAAKGRKAASWVLEVEEANFRPYYWRAIADGHVRRTYSLVDCLPLYEFKGGLLYVFPGSPQERIMWFMGGTWCFYDAAKVVADIRNDACVHPLTLPCLDAERATNRLIKAATDAEKRAVTSAVQEALLDVSLKPLRRRDGPRRVPEDVVNVVQAFLPLYTHGVHQLKRWS
jgi:hypothetical protein